MSNWTLFSIKKVKIRKPHDCHGCGQSFSIGTEMTNTKGCWDGEGFVSTYQCNTCQKIQDSLSSEELKDFEDGFEKGWIWNYYHGYGFETPEQILESIETNIWPEVESSSYMPY